MKGNLEMRRLSFLALFVSILLALGSACSNSKTKVIGKEYPTNNTELIKVQSDAGTWGINVDRKKVVSFEDTKPVKVEFYYNSKRESIAVGYDQLEKEPNGGFTGIALVNGPDETELSIEDEWSIKGSIVSLARHVAVSGRSSAGFMTGVTLSPDKKFSRSELDIFAPGMIYGSTAYLTDIAIGGSAAYEKGKGEVWIREDRLPAPLFGTYFPDGSSVAVLNPSPKGNTTLEDAYDTEVKPFIDERLTFGSIGSKINNGKMETGFWYPGTEGEVTYEGNTYPDGQLHKWRLRYHPLKEGVTQNYKVAFRFDQQKSFPAFYASSWRWAWQTLNPQLVPHDIKQVRRSLIDMLADRVKEREGRVGIPNFVIASSEGNMLERDKVDLKQAIMGFTGKNLESANFLLQEALNDSTVRGKRLRNLATGIINTFTRLKMSPPVGEGLNINTGEPAIAIPRDGVVYLRSFSDAFKALMKAIIREKEHDIEHPGWGRWAKEFGNWLLTQQYSNGGFPRSWRPVTGEIADSSENTSYNPIPFLVLLNKYTSKAKYLDSAIKAGEFTWNQTQQEGAYFIGGTIDNPDVIDKEAGTLSLEAYLALYEKTQNKKWLDRAEKAGEFAESWIYIWNIPMPESADNSKLHWKKGVPTVGLQLISTGHSLVDEYMAYEVDDFAKLYEYTGYKHYKEVACILLHNTNSMMALPGRLYDLKGPGWQQEHWSLAPKRGYGLHRGWLPWVSTSHLNGIFGLMEFDPSLFQELKDK